MQSEVKDLLFTTSFLNNPTVYIVLLGLEVSHVLSMHDVRYSIIKHFEEAVMSKKTIIFRGLIYVLYPISLNQ